MPMLIDSSLDQLNVGFGDSPFSDGNGKHFHSISEQNRRRQQKMHGNEKNFESRRILREIGPDCGLK